MCVNVCTHVFALHGCVNVYVYICMCFMEHIAGVDWREVCVCVYVCVCVCVYMHVLYETHCKFRSARGVCAYVCVHMCVCKRVYIDLFARHVCVCVNVCEYIC